MRAKIRLPTLVGVGCGCGWRDGHLLVGELESLSDGLYVFCGVLGGWRGAGIRSDVGRKCWFATRSDHRGRRPVGFMGIALRVSMIPGTLSTQALVDGPSSKRARSMLFRVWWLLSLMALPSG